MSIRIPIDDIPHARKQDIIKDLQFKDEKKNKWIHPYNVVGDDIYIPFSYAVSLGFDTPSRVHYETVGIEFRGTLRDYQKEVKVQAIEMLNKKGSTLLSLHVGWGKSMFAIYLATKLRFKTLIVVNRLILIKQWTDLITHVTGSKYQILNSKSPVLINDCDFYLINATNVSKLPCGFLGAIGTVICDEIHLICADSLYKCMFAVTPRYLIGLSATAYRPDGLDKLIGLYFGAEKILKELHKKHTVYAIHTDLKIEFKLGWDGKMDWNSVLNSQAQHPTRNQMIVDIVRAFPDRYFLVLCKRIEQGIELLRLLEGEYVTDLLGVKKEFDEQARIVVATGQKVGVGFSHDKLDALILACDIEQYFIQYLGRVFRTPDSEPIIFDLVDDLSVLKRHYATRKAVYRKAGGIIRDINDLKTFLKN